MLAYRSSSSSRGCLLGIVMAAATSVDGQATWRKGAQHLAACCIIAAPVHWMPVIMP
jgi:hypothetical protein